jgi:hypothetical protein
MASSSSVKRLAELRGSSHLKAEGVWAYRRPKARDGLARHLEVCRAIDVFIVGEVKFSSKRRCVSVTRSSTGGNIQKSHFFTDAN